MRVDVAIVGGGIVGISTALQLQSRHREVSVAVIEKESDLATHQSCRNSGVIHAGVYYQPGSLKAKFCRMGVAETIAFCKRHGLPHEQCGKLIVATRRSEFERLDNLQGNATQNGLTVSALTRSELEALEPNIAGERALLVKDTGIVDYSAVARKMAELFRDNGGVVLTGHEVVEIAETPAAVEIVCGNGEKIAAGNMIACAGLHADRVGKMCGIDNGVRIIPFRGEYYRLPDHRNGMVEHVIYPVPDPALPFLGVHLTKMIGGFITVGPNAVLAFSREGYSYADIDPGELAGMLGFSGFRSLAARFYRSGIAELHSSLFRGAYLNLCRRYCPQLTLDDLQPYRSGVRAQAVLADGTMVHDFMIERTARTLHVLNAPSPAATSSIPVGAHLVALAEQNFEKLG